MSSEERALQCLGLGKLCSRRCRVRPVIVMITGRFFAFEGGVSGDYGSGKRDLQYFRKRKPRDRKDSMRITEVVGKTCLTSVKSEQVGGLGEQGLRKWGEKLAILP